MFSRRLTATLLLLVFLVSLIPITPVSALVWNTGVTFNCDNEYYSVTTPLTVDSISISTHWFSVNGIGYNITFGGTILYNNFSSIQSNPTDPSTNGYIVNWTQQKSIWTASSFYEINGLKASYDYILYSNGTSFPHTTTAAGVLIFSSATTSTNRNYALYDPGIPNTWFVATTGSDSNSGSILSPFATIQKAINSSTTSDDIYIRAGTYTPTWITFINRSGTAGDWYTISNYNNEAVEINGTNIPTTEGFFTGIFEMDNRSYVRITGLKLNYSSVGGVMIEDNCDHIQVDNCTIGNCTSFAFKVDNSPTPSEYIYLQDCLIEENMDNHSGKVGQETVSLSEVSYFWIQNNTFRNNFYHNIDLKAGSNNGYIDHNTFNLTAPYQIQLFGGVYRTGGNALYIDCHGQDVHNVSFFNNLVYGNVTGIQMNTETSGNYENISVYNCIINITNITGGDATDLVQYGIYLQNAGGSASVFKDIDIYCNTIKQGVNNIYEPLRIRTTLTSTILKRVNISNNIFSCDNKTTSGFMYRILDVRAVSSLSSGSIFLNNNLFHNFFAGATFRIGWSDGDYTSASPTKWGNSPLFTDPEYVSPNPVYDFHINATSPAVGAATSSIVPSFDFDDVVRPQGGTYDIGAYEYIAGAGVAYVPYATNPYPASSQSSIVMPLSTLNITITDQNGDTMDLYFRSNYTGTWTTIDTNLSIANGTYYCVTPGLTGLSKYWWSVNITDGSLWGNHTYNFTIWYPTEGITLHGVKANWTTNTAINLTWTKGANTTNTYIFRSETGYMVGWTCIYTGTNSYYNDTLKDPTIRYYYSLYPYNSVSLMFGTRIDAILAETDPCTSYGSSWLEFPGYLVTGQSVRARFDYSTTSSFTSTLWNATIEGPSYTTGYDSTLNAAKYLNGTLQNIGQSFETGSTGYYIYNVSIYAARSGSPGFITVSIWEANTSGANYGKPVGTANTSGSTNANLWSSWTWRNITLTPYLLKPNTRYCVVVSTPSGNVVNYILWGTDKTAPAYSDGCAMVSIGTTYTNYSRDCLFEIWGKDPETIASFLMTSNTTITTTQAYDITQSELQFGQLYYYRGYANDSSGNLSRGNIRYSLTRPDMPTFLNLVPNFGNNSVNISWITGTGANNTVLVYSTTSYPTTADEGITAYNGTGVYDIVPGIDFNVSYYFTLFSFTVWGDLSRYSSGVTLPWGGITFIVRNQSAPWQVINATITVTDSEGINPVQFTNVYGFYSFNITQIPYGENTLFYVTNSSYAPQLFVIDVEGSIFYNLTFYLPPLTQSGTGPEGWNETASYMVQVLNEYQYPVPDAAVKFYVYMNYTENYSYIGGFVSDGTGQGSITLFPYQLYMVKITCDGFEEATYFWAPNVVEQGLIKQFMIYPVVVESYLWDNINVSIEPINRNQNGSFTVYFNITSSESELEWFSGRVYRIQNVTGTLISLYSGNYTTASGGTVSYTISNTTGRYYFRCMFKKDGFDTYKFGDQSQYTYILGHYDASVHTLEDKIVKVIGRSPVYVITASGETVVSYMALFATFIIIMVLFTLSPKFAGFAIVLLGLLLGFLKGPLGLFSDVILNWTVASTIIMLGIILAITKKKEEETA